MRQVRRRLWHVAGAAVVAVGAASLVALPAAPSSATTLPSGPDVSGWQHPSGASINWPAVASGGNAFAIIKATEATTYTNPYYASDTAGARAAHLVVGTYHFARPALPISTAVDQATYFVNTAAHTGGFRQAGTMPPILDLEVNGGLSAGDLVTWAQTWLETVRKLTGRTPVVYSYPSFWPDYMGNAPVLTRYPLWIASYSSSPTLIGGWSNYALWQYTSSASVSGIPGAGSVDMSHFNGSTSALASFANGTTTTSWPVSAPHAPYRVSATPGSSAATVSWVPGDDGGQVPTSYTVRCSNGQSKTVPGTSTAVVFTGLSANTSYTFTVSATNSAGTGPASAPTAPVRPGSAPTVPTGLTATAGNTSVTLRWNPSSNAPTSYKLYRCSPAPCTPTALYATFTGTTFLNTLVTPGVSYAYAVAAANGYGTSALSGSVTATPYGLPSAPTNLTAAGAGSGVNVTWTAPTNTGGSPLTGYRLTIDGGSPITVPVGTSYPVNGLLAGTHTFALAALNRYGAGAATTATVPNLPGIPVIRTAGADRYGTASDLFALSAHCAPVAILARGDQFPDALAASYLASVEGPGAATANSDGGTAVLLTPPTGLTGDTLALMQRMGVQQVFVVGGPAAVSDSVLSTINSTHSLQCGTSTPTANGPLMQATRIGGSDRYQTAALAARYAGTSPVGSADYGTGLKRTAILATGLNFPDAVASGPAAYWHQFPLILTRSDVLSPDAAAALKALGIQQVVIAGGPIAVSTGVESAVQHLGISTVRAAGTERTATAAAMAKLFFAGKASTLARGDDFSDALAAGPLVGKSDSGLLLTLSPNSLGAGTANFLSGLSSPLSKLWVIGGPTAVSNTVVLAAGQAMLR